jgi:arginine-tRNA-protein transferase
MVLSEINHCRKNRLGWLYLGFLVRGCAKMEYKARYKPHEVLEGGIWVRYDD